MHVMTCKKKKYQLLALEKCTIFIYLDILTVLIYTYNFSHTVSIITIQYDFVIFLEFKAIYSCEEDAYHFNLFCLI